VLFAGSALAGIVGGVPPDADEVTLLLCAPASTCAEEARWIDERAAGPVLLFVEALATAAEDHAVAAERRRRLDEALSRARAEYDAGRWVTADTALSDAEALLLDVPGPIPQQALFDLLFLRGATALARDNPQSPGWFAQAAAVAWNRTVALPVADGPVASAYHAAQHALLHAPTGTLALAAPPAGAVWALDGIELGAAAAEVQVFPGPHRLTASIPGKARSWVELVEVRPGARVPVEARFAPDLEAEAIAGAIRGVFAGGEVEGGAVDALSAWITQRGLDAVTLAWVDGTPFSTRQMRFDPRLRRFER
jgi:hypothetical protein